MEHSHLTIILVTNHPRIRSLLSEKTSARLGDNDVRMLRYSPQELKTILLGKLGPKLFFLFDDKSMHDAMKKFFDHSADVRLMLRFTEAALEYSCM